MDRAGVVSVYFTEESARNAVPEAVRSAAPARRLRDAFEPVSMHAVWSPLVHERMAARGLNFFMTYVWGRACVMGEPAGAVVAAAFAAFEPTYLAPIYDAARALVPRDEALDTTIDSTAESLRRVLGDEGVDGPGNGAGGESDVASVADRLALVVDGLEPVGRPLFSGVQSLGWPTDPYGRLWQACLALREHRGDGHVAAYLNAGFDPVQMNLLTELWLGYPLGGYSGSRGWSAERTAVALDSLRSAGLLDGDALTDAGATARAAVESATDALQHDVVEALGDDLDHIVAHLDRWSARCVDAAMFPPDPRKRAAG